MFNAYMDEPQAVKKDVMNYVNMIIGIDAKTSGPTGCGNTRTPRQVS